MGDEIEMTYYVADEKGSLRTAKGTFILKGIVAMEGPGSDSGVTPSFEGLTDAETMGQWDPPFPIDLKRIRPEDETYWNAYGTTPKVYLPQLKVQYLWRPWPVPPYVPPQESGSPGWITSVRVAPMADHDLETSGRRFAEAFLRRSDPSRFGLLIDDVAEEALGSAKGSSDFGVLFVSMSMFIVAAAAGLVGLLFRLTIEGRASQYGILMATGFRVKQAARVLMGEGVILALIGAMLGVPLGVGYAALIILALRTLWTGAVGDFVFSLHVTPLSLIIGGVAGFLISVMAIRWALRVLRRSRVLTLLFGWRALAATPGKHLRRRSLEIAMVSLAAAAILLLSGVFGVLAPTGAFFGGGALLLVGLLALCSAQLQRPPRTVSSRHMSLWRLGRRGSSRNWLRSLLTCGLIACACFVVVAVAANQRDLTRVDSRRSDSPSGGFSLLARSTTPLYVDLNSPEGRKNLAFPPEASQILDSATFYGFRLSAGDDISCLNIQRPGRPRILGVPKEMIERGGFVFAKTSDTASAGGKGHPWRLLTDSVLHDVSGDSVIPAIADAASAQWILHVGLGEDIEITDRQGEPVRLRLVGLLAGSLFQSEVLISEEDFRLHFDADSGYRYYLIDAPSQSGQAVADTLRKNLGEHGFDVRRTVDVLAGYARVQDTYLRTFQTLGGLGLALGTFGIVTVLLRSVVERRNEFAMLLALGFRRSQVVRVLLIENGLLLLSGTVGGGAAALVAVAPHLVSAVASVNWLSLLGTVLICVVVGLLSCGISAAVSVRRELLSALRSE